MLLNSMPGFKHHFSFPNSTSIQVSKKPFTWQFPRACFVQGRIQATWPDNDLKDAPGGKWRKFECIQNLPILLIFNKL